jgi:hypothetical protein
MTLPSASRMLAGLWGCTLVACATPGDPAADAERLATELRERTPPTEGGALRVELAFDPAFDLDLYVTDPLEEAVYFANERSASGGRLEADRHCGGQLGPGVQIETVVFPDPAPGRYRVGVDHPRVCGGDARPAAFAVRVEGEGRVAEITGIAQPLLFEAIVLEFVVESP